nr:hypothetical protein B0A51_11043 [Rachicladosporium sp. CCFEE 5018]
MASDDGASPKEQLFEACRRNNTSLLQNLLSTPPFSSAPKKIASFLNTTTSPLGASALHIAAAHGSYETLDLLLDQEGLEIDHTEPREGDTALHCAVRWCNSQGPQGWEEGKGVVEILVDAGCDPRIRNKARLRPVELLDPRCGEVREVLQRAEMGMMAGLGAGGDVVEESDGEGGAGSESD